jgi:hypothetical protein
VLERDGTGLRITVVAEEVVVHQRHGLDVGALHDVVAGDRVPLFVVILGQVGVEHGTAPADIAPVQPHFRQGDLFDEAFKNRLEHSGAFGSRWTWVNASAYAIYANWNRRPPKSNWPSPLPNIKDQSLGSRHDRLAKCRICPSCSTENTGASLSALALSEPCGALSTDMSSLRLPKLVSYGAGA